MSFDIHQGKDACDAASYEGIGLFDFVWLHPPYWRQKKYTNDPRDLSACPTLSGFLHRYHLLLLRCESVLIAGGRMAILMGDYADQEEGFVPLVYHTQRLCFAIGLRQKDTQIIRFSHGASSSKKTYRSAFIPGLHDVCTILKKPSVLLEK